MDLRLKQGYAAISPGRVGLIVFEYAIGVNGLEGENEGLPKFGMGISMKNLYTVSNIEDFVKNFLTKPGGNVTVDPGLDFPFATRSYLERKGLINREGGGRK